MQKKKLIIVLLTLMLLAILAMFIYFLINPVLLKSNTVIVEYKKTFDISENIRYVFFGNKEDVKLDVEINTEELGTFDGNYLYKDKKIPVHIEVKDITKPKMKLRPVKTDMVEEIKPELFVETIEDDTPVEFSFENEILDKDGEQEVTIVAKDACNNITKKQTQLTRRKDVTAPELNVEENISFKLGTEYDLSEYAYITDDLDPAPLLEIDTSMVNFNEAGNYTIIFLGKDRSGNQVSVERNLEIQENPELYQKIVYLTFDDGPSNNTEKILDILDRYHAKASFFVTGTRQQYNSNISKAFQAGHSIGLHTYTHDYASVYSSIQAYFNDLNAINDMVESITGQRSNIIRFPGGSSNMISADYCQGIMSELVIQVRDKGYQYFDWNCDSTDASGNNVPVQTIVDNATSSNEQYINILMHDTDAKDTTVEALPKIIEYYQKQGYIFKGLDAGSFACHHGVNN